MDALQQQVARGLAETAHQQSSAEFLQRLIFASCYGPLVAAEIARCRQKAKEEADALGQAEPKEFAWQPGVCAMQAHQATEAALLTFGIKIQRKGNGVS